MKIKTRQDAEQRLRISEGRYRCLVESLERDYIIYSHDIHGTFTYLSPSITNVLGYTAAEFMGHYSDYMTDNPVNRNVEEYTMLAIRGEKQPPYDAEYWHRNGTRVYMRVTEVPIFDESGNVLSIEGIVQDITELKKAEREREELINTLRKALSEVKTLKGLLPICSKCKKIRDENGEWQHMELYFKTRTEADFTHGFCPACYEQALKDIEQGKE